MSLKYLVRITLMAVVTEEEANCDRLLIDGDGCPLNILPEIVSAAEEHGEAMNTCPFCGGRAHAEVLREATPDDEANYTWPRPKP